MNMFNMHQAKTHLSRLVRDACNGKEIVIGKAGEPLVKLVAFRIDDGPRKPGAWKGKVRIRKDFDELPPEFLDALAA